MSPRPAPTPLPERIFGTFVPKEGRASVGLVFEGGRHYQCGFRQGDIILSISGTPILNFQQFLSYPFFKELEYEFTVRGTDGAIRTIRSKR